MEKQLTTTEKRNEAWQAYTTLKEAFINQAKLFLFIGKLAKDIRDKKLYKFLGRFKYGNPYVDVCDLTPINQMI